MPLTVVSEQGMLSLTVADSVLHTEGFKVTHEVIVIVLDPSSPLTVVAATEVVIVPSLLTVAVSFGKLGLVVKVLVKAQPDGVVVNRISLPVAEKAAPVGVL